MRDAELERDLAWTRRQMPITRAACARLPDLSSVRLACSIHLDIKMAPVIEAILERGARVYLVTANPSTVRDEVVAHLVGRGAEARAWRGIGPADQADALDRALDWSPTHLCEMGAELSARLHDRQDRPAVRAALEATGSGIARLRGLALRYPVFNWDDLPVKEGLHNRWLVGLSTWQAFLERTRLSLHGKRVLVVGYGLVGQGVAEIARAFGGTVTVVERDPARALEASYAGWPVAEFDAATLGRTDVLVTATGRPGIIGPEQLELLPDGCFLLNVGHVPDEIVVRALGPRREVLPFVEEASPFGRTLFLFAGGSMANLTAGQGDSLNAFDLTAAVMTDGLAFSFTTGPTFRPGLRPLPREAWAATAGLAAARARGER